MGIPKIFFSRALRQASLAAIVLKVQVVKEPSQASEPAFASTSDGGLS